MAGGLLQLVATGTQDGPLTYNPDFTFFKIVYKRYTNFAIQQTIKNLGTKNFNTYNSYKIDKTGDLLQSAHLILDIPYFNIIKTNTTSISSSELNINQLEIIYNNYETLLFYLNNNIYCIPIYNLKLFNLDYYLQTLDSSIILNNLLPSILNNNNFLNNYILIDIKENTINPIISLLRKYNNFFQDLWINLLSTNINYEYNNNLIIQSSYLSFINTEINNYFYTNYNFYNNNQQNKQYYNLSEMQQYMKYLIDTDPSFIIQDNYDMDVTYNYCTINNLDYKLYQNNTLFYTSTLIYNILLQLYPSNFNTFTFWKKYSLLSDNIVNTSFIINSFNTFGEWTTNFNNTINLLNINIQLYDIFKKNYSIIQNNIIQLFSLINIDNPSQLFIILSTFINQYNLTSTKINFDDFNSLTNTNILNQQINSQLNNYANLTKSNAAIYAIPNIANHLTIFPVDLMVIYPYLAYNLVENIIGSNYFSNNMFLVYWRNKINNFYFLNYRQFYKLNLNNSDLYDLTSLNRNLTFYANFDMNKMLFLSNIKKYFLDLFFSSSFCGSVNISDNDYITLKSSLNLIQPISLSVNNVPIAISESTIKQFNLLELNTKYTIDIFQQKNNQLIIPNWNNNYNDKTIFIIQNNNILYTPIDYTINNFILTLSFKNLPIINNFILIEKHELNIPIVSFYNPTQYPSNNFNSINIFKKINNNIVFDNILSENIFNISNLPILIDTIINNYFNFFQTLKITTSTDTFRYNINIDTNNGKYLINSLSNIEFNKKNILSVDVEFLQIIYTDLGTQDGTTIIDNQFIFTSNSWTYNNKFTYWLVYNNIYIPLTYFNITFSVLGNFQNVIYTIREINNDSLPSFFNYLNYYQNTTSPSDLMDFFFQTPMIFLVKNHEFPSDITQYNNAFTIPYLYFYNIPFIISSQTEILINTKLVNIILPLNSNQFFGKYPSTLFDTELLFNKIDHYKLISLMSSTFDSIYQNPLYNNIINTLEQVKIEMVNLNTNILNNSANYGKTTNLIINNSKIINKIDIFNYNYNNFSYYNNLALELYGNNSTIINDSVVQNIKLYIYNYPLVSYLPNRKIKTDLINYLNYIPTFYQNQFNYIQNNTDYEIVTLPTEYNESYQSLDNIKLNIEQTALDYSQIFNISTLYSINNLNLNSIYYQNQLLTISSVIDNTILCSNLSSSIINNEDMYETTILNNYPIKFINYGPIYYNEEINFYNSVNISGYNYIELDDGNIYKLNSNNNNNYNQVLINSKLYNIQNTENTITFYLSEFLLYYYKIKINTVTDLSLYNYLFNDNNYYYELLNDNIIQIISNNSFDYTNKNYFIGYKQPTQQILDFVNTINFSHIDFITISSFILLEYNTFNYYNIGNITNNFICNNKINPLIITINNLNLININSNKSIVTFNLLSYTILHLPPIKIDNNFNIINYNGDEDNYIERSSNCLIKLDNYIFTNNIILPIGNYNLSLLDLGLETLILVNYDIMGYITISNNLVNIIFNNYLVIPDNSYYLINNSFIYIESLKNITISSNINYYNSGIFNNIKLLDNNYFDQQNVQIINYISDISMNQDLLGNSIISYNNIYNNYDINSLLYNNSYDIFYDISHTLILGTDEIKINLLFNNNFIRPVIIKNRNQNQYPICQFIYTNNNQIYTNSFIVQSTIPEISVGFVTLEIIFNQPITKLEPLEPIFNIMSNTQLTHHIISFNDTSTLNINQTYLWKFIINNIYPVYLWTLFTTNFINYSNDQISEPIYIDSLNLNLFTISTNYIGSIPNILINKNNMLEINTNLYYSYIKRTLANRYYFNNLYLTGNMKILKYNFHLKYKPKLNLLQTNNISFNNNYIYINLSLLNTILNVKYVIIQDTTKYYYATIINNDSTGIYVNINLLNIKKIIAIYYSLNDLIFTNNKITINNNQIVNYQYNELEMNEIILVDNCLFIVLGLNYWTNYYDLQLLNGTLLNNNINGYYSLGVINRKENIIFPKIHYQENLIYVFDSYNLKIGDYYIVNNSLKMKTSNYLDSDIFYYYNNGSNITINVINKKFYYFGIQPIIKENTVVYNNNIYKIKIINNKEIIFYNNFQLRDGSYIFYYPYQPFNLDYIQIINNNIVNKIIQDYSYIDINGTFYQVINNQLQNNNILDNYYIVRIVNYKNNNLFFENEILLDSLVDFNTSNITNDITVSINATLIDSYTINTNINNLFVNYFYYLQPIKINSSINYISQIFYRSSTTLISTIKAINTSSTNVKIYFTPNIININTIYSIFNINNFSFPQIINDTSNNISNIVSYNINSKLESIFIGQPGFINFYNNYIPISFNNTTSNNTTSNNTVIINNYEIGTYHLLLEITKENINISHLVKIIYPNNLYFYSNIINSDSTFYIDKIYKVSINYDTGYYQFIENIFFSKTRLLDTNTNILDVWYKYDVTIIGTPEYVNNLFRIQIDNGNTFLDKDVYISLNSSEIYSVQLINKKYYLLSNIYLGNNINALYIKNINYVKNIEPINKTWKTTYTQHNDPLLYKYINSNDQSWEEKITIPVIIELDIIGDYYKYKLYQLNTEPILLNPNNTYSIGDQSLQIVNTFLYNNTTYIFTQSAVPNIINNITQLYITEINNNNYFNKINLSKTVPELFSKIKKNIIIYPFMIFNYIKPWTSWSILSNYNNIEIQHLMNKGDIIYNNNTIIQNNNNIYFTNNELLFLSNLLIFINNNTNEYTKIIQQQLILNLILNELPLWLNDSTFWLNVNTRINQFLVDNNFINVSFNGTCLVFSDEINNPEQYFDSNNKRLYYLNNQYILNQNTISRNMNNITNEINLFINNNQKTSSYGIEINELLFTLSNFSTYYIFPIISDIPKYNYLNSIKLFTGIIWSFYKNSLSLLNSNFNTNYIINYNYSQSNINKYYSFSNLFDFNLNNNISLSISNEIYIYDYQEYNNNFYKYINVNYSLISDAIYPYKITFSQDIVFPDVFYELNFMNKIFDPVLFNIKTYPIEMNFYLLNDINIDTDYYIIGLTKYNTISTLLGILYQINSNININFNLVNTFNYKNNNIIFNSYKNNILELISNIEIDINTFIELINYVGISKQNNNYLYFYQNNFNYIQNNTYIRTDNIFIPLYIDISGNYYINQNIILPQSVNIVILFYISNIINTNNYIYQLELDKEFINYNDYINNLYNILPINFKLNDNIIPNNINFNTANILIINISNKLQINTVTHYAHVGELPPTKIISLLSNKFYLYKTYDTFKLLNTSYILVYDISDNIYDLSNNIINIDLSNNVGIINNLDQTNIQFLLNKLYSYNNLITKYMLIVDEWIITDYLFNPLNNSLQFDYPLNLVYKNTSQYNYTINNQIVNKNLVEILHNKLIIFINYSISGNFSFKKIYKSNSIIYKPSNNQLVEIKLQVPNQYTNSKKIYLIPYDNLGNEIGSIIYKVILDSPINLYIDNIQIQILSDDTYNGVLFYLIDDYTCLITSNANITNYNNLYLLFPNYSILLNILNISVYQNSYIPGDFYYQNNLDTLNIFIPENINSIDFTNQLISCNYYFVSINYGIVLNNIFNSRNITSSNNMQLITNIQNNTTTIIEEPIFTNVVNWFNSLSIYLGDQCIETLNNDSLNIIYYYYSNAEKKKQIDNIVKIRKNINGWQVMLPLTFWFSSRSGLAIPFVALPYIDLYFKYKINNLNNILLNDITSSQFSTHPEIKIQICLDTIYLDTPERKLFGSYNHEYIIEKYNNYPSNLVYKINQSVPIKLSNLIKDIFFITQPIYHNNDNCYKTVRYERDTKCLEYTTTILLYNQYKLNPVFTDEIPISYASNFSIIDAIEKEIKINKSVRINRIKTDLLLKNQNLEFILFIMDKYLLNIPLEIQIKHLNLYFIYLFENKEIVIETSTIESFNLQSNGNDLFYNMPQEYFNLVIPYQKYNSSVPLGYYCYSFSLFPLEDQPSGHLNFNQIDNVSINLINNNNILNEPYNLKIIVKEYQILRIMSGLGSLAWLT